MVIACDYELLMYAPIYCSLLYLYISKGSWYATIMLEIGVCSLTSLVLVIILLFESSKPLAASDQYKTVQRSCDRSSECNSANGEMCYWMYDGCSKGFCMCNPYTHSKDPRGKCSKERSGGEYCETGDLCPDGMSCLGNQCSCIRGKLTADKQFCTLGYQQLLGEACVPSYTKCLQKASYGYTENDVWCSGRGVCDCEDGYKADGVSCRKWEIGEFGCARAFQCEGGAICADGQCICPTGYLPTASNTKCAKRGALTNLPVGAVCDEINERRYCAHELVCHRCNGQTKSMCVKFLLSTRWARQTGRAPSLHTSTGAVLFSVLISFFVARNAVR
ncbi:hypothetical protein CAPTEDRAFT_224408 [Capitella teleta]|uniref:EB domain-containing protein n=1 Tax=Capitella teleta TaxID=283909 RepID=R7UIU6_CAPTE|nr:hypothetical protein CAPTEDRAFT_224408 [Capitella teleta]|eukprot:ELU06085.1 hypothetical protein CAPTEDRAFT_224408 [Capitella teleta]